MASELNAVEVKYDTGEIWYLKFRNLEEFEKVMRRIGYRSRKDGNVPISINSIKVNW